MPVTQPAASDQSHLFSATVRPFPAKGSVRRSVSTGLSEVEYQSEGYGPITDDTKKHRPMFPPAAHAAQIRLRARTQTAAI